MSKAFTRESDDLLIDDIAPSRPQTAARGSVYITREGAERLTQRLHDLVEERRSTGGSNAATDTNGKAALKRLDLEIQKLHSTFDSVIIAEPPADQEKVALGAWVEVRDQDGDRETYQIVGPNESDPTSNRISSASPLARVLLHRRPGETVAFKSPAGLRRLTLLTVRY